MADSKDAKSAVAAPKVEGSIYVPAKIVDVLWKHFLPFQGSTPITKSGDAAAPQPDADAITADMDRLGYMMVYARRKTPRAGRDRQIFVIVGADSKFSGHVPDLKKLLMAVQLDHGIKEKTLDTVTFIASDQLLEKKQLVEVIMGANSAPITADNTEVIYTVRPYRNFLSNLAADVEVAAKARIMPPDEVKAYLARERLKAADLQAVPSSDPLCVWYGVRSGQVLQVFGDSETAMVKSVLYNVT